MCFMIRVIEIENSMVQYSIIVNPFKLILKLPVIKKYWFFIIPPIFK